MKYQVGDWVRMIVDHPGNRNWPAGHVLRIMRPYRMDSAHVGWFVTGSDRYVIYEEWVTAYQTIKPKSGFAKFITRIDSA